MESLRKFNDVGGLAKSYVGLEKKLTEIGQTHIRMPGEDATPEDRAAFYNRIGRPEKADEYSPTVEAKVELSPELMSKAREVMHQHGVTKEAGEAILNFYVGDVLNAGLATGEKAAEAAEAALRQEWGSKYDQAMRMVEGALGQFGSKGLIDTLNQSGLANNPEIFKFLHNVAEGMLDDSQLDAVAAQSLNMTKMDAKAEIEALKGNEEFQKALMDNVRNTPAAKAAHDAAVKKWRGLHQLAYPNTES